MTPTQVVLHGPGRAAPGRRPAQGITRRIVHITLTLVKRQVSGLAAVQRGGPDSPRFTDQKLTVAEVARWLDVGENLLWQSKQAFLDRGYAAFLGDGNPAPADDERCPLTEAEAQYAVDSSDFGTTRYTRWIDAKYRVPWKEHDWVTVYIITGIRTNCVTAAEGHDRNTNDCVILPSPVDTTAERFTLSGVSAAKAWAADSNFEAVARHGGTLYATVRKNTTGGVGRLYEKMFYLSCANRDAYLKHSHCRGSVEATFSAIKRKFGDSIRSKTDVAMQNEVDAKPVAQNVCCLISAMCELGLTPPK